jgi:uncharacterized protein (TIGR02147 family)
MLSIFEFRNYRNYLAAWIEAQGARSYGLKGKMAASLSVSSSLVSQILSGDKGLTPDQAASAAEFIGLSEIEGDYLHLLVDHDRASLPLLRQRLERKITALQAQSQQLGKRVPRSKELTDAQKAIYYSSWLYTGIRNLTAVAGFSNVDAIATHLHLDAVLVAKVLRFLIENGLCKEENSQFTYATASTHVDHDSPFVNKHHQNWRFQAIQKMESRKAEDLFFTSPMSLSRQAASEIRILLPTVVQAVMKISGPSTSETTSCLNIDWFSY